MTDRANDYAFDIRLLGCEGCGAPLDVPAEGGRLTCAYCGATSQFRPLKRRAVDAPSARQESERIRRLRAQPLAPVELPDDIRPLFDTRGVVPDSALASAEPARRRALELLRAEPHDPEAQRRVFVLTSQLAGRFTPRENRAMLEAALELLPPGPQTQELYGKLARGAAKAGDLFSAQRWLELLEPRSELLQMDSIYRITRAYVETAKGNFQGVLDTLMFEGEFVPIALGHEILSETLRTNALEKVGRFDEAVQLMASVLAAAPHVGSVVDLIVRHNASLDLCPRSLPRAREVEVVD